MDDWHRQPIIKWRLRITLSRQTAVNEYQRCSMSIRYARSHHLPFACKPNTFQHAIVMVTLTKYVLWPVDGHQLYAISTLIHRKAWRFVTDEGETGFNFTKIFGNRWPSSGFHDYSSSPILQVYWASYCPHRTLEIIRSVMANGYTRSIFVIFFLQGDNFCDFLFTFLNTKPVLKRNLL